MFETENQYTVPTHQLGLEYAIDQDKNDILSHYRTQFHIPKSKAGTDLIYMTGNSLGLQPKQTKAYVNQELEDWALLGVEGHFEAQNPWLNYHELLTKHMADVVGAKPIEVVVMNTLTANLHFMMASFYQPTAKRYKILIESDAFPSDTYAVESQLRHHGFDPKDGLIKWTPPKGKELLDHDDLEELLEQEGKHIALIMLGGVNYYTGQFLDLKRITALGHRHGCMVGFDCAHGAGNVQLDLHNSGADFAAWCTYKYLNSGPGSLAGCFVHERHAYRKDLNRFAGWWSHNKKTRFNMRDPYDQLPGAEGWQLSNPPILSMAAIKSSLDIFAAIGMETLIKKSQQLTSYFEFLLKDLGEDTIRIITPTAPNARGCQLSIQVKQANKSLHEKLTAAGVISDWREPDVIRCAPVPLYNSFQDVYHLVQKLKTLLTP